MKFLFTDCNVADVVFILDSSGSIKDDDPGNWDLLKSFVAQAILDLGVAADGVHVGMVEFRCVVGYSLVQYVLIWDCKIVFFEKKIMFILWA